MNRFLVQFVVPTFLGPVALVAILPRLSFGPAALMAICIGAFPAAFLSVYYTAMMELAVSRGLRPGSVGGVLLSVLVGMSAVGGVGFLLTLFSSRPWEEILLRLGPWLEAGALVGAVTGMLVCWCEQRWPADPSLN